MELNNFDDFLAAARAQDEPQQLLFVFTAAELPQQHSPGQKKRFEAGGGGALAPVMCVDKSPAELASFAALAEESRQTGQPWDMVFVAALPGRDGQPPGGQDVERALKMMIDAVHRGAIERFAAFAPSGQPVRFF